LQNRPGRSRNFARVEARLATALAALLGWGILTLWVPRLWAAASVQVGICLLAGIWLAAAWRTERPIRGHALMIPLGGAVAWAALQLALGTTVYRWATGVALLDWFTRLAVFGLGVQVFAAAGVRERVLRWAGWFGFAIAAAASLQRFTSDRVFWLFPVEAGGITMGPFVNYNQYAAFIETLLPLVLVWCLRERRWVYPVMAAVMAASVIAGTSRAGTFAIGLETLAVVGLWRLRERRGFGPAAAAAAGLAVLFVAAIGWEPLVSKFERPDQWGVRRELFYSTLDMARDRPWIGFGLGTWSSAYPAYARFDDGIFENQAHNDWAQWAAEGGVPFLALMLAMAALLARPALRTTWGVGLLAVLVHCLVDYHFQQRPVFGYYWFALAAACVAAERDQ
jgi:hypothetical protein